ncbi:MAG: hypothetical protein LBB56_08530 [Chitinispirillales bacterium]|nr:hypothetical protein [Chitinispirillales bacterium]
MKIRHSIEELKLYISLLGMDIHDAAAIRADELTNAKVYRDMSQNLAKHKKSIQ